MQRIVFLLIWLLIVLLSIYTGTSNILYVILYCYFIIFFVYRKDRCYLKIAKMSYAFYAFLGTLAYVSYLYFSGETFAPFFDDSYYYRNITTIWSGNISSDINYTAFEFFMAFVSLPFSWFGTIEHYELLPINWMLGAMFVTEAVKFSWKVMPSRGKDTRMIGMLLVLCNYACIDSCIHLYRDAFLGLFYVLALNYIYENKKIKGLVCSIVVLFVRGANGFILFAYLLGKKIQELYHLNRKQILYGALFVFVVGLYFMDSINYQKLGRFTSTGDAGYTISERIENFKESDGGGQVIKMLRSNNIIFQMLAIPAYMISPIQVKEIMTISEYNTIYDRGRVVLRLRIESLGELIHILVYVVFFIPILYGAWLWFNDSSPDSFILCLLFLATLVAVTFISMQVRHKLAFILYTPILYNYYINNTSQGTKKIVNALSVGLGIIIFVYNFVM